MTLTNKAAHPAVAVPDDVREAAGWLNRVCVTGRYQSAKCLGDALLDEGAQIANRLNTFLATPAAQQTPVPVAASGVGLREAAVALVEAEAAEADARQAHDELMEVFNGEFAVGSLSVEDIQAYRQKSRNLHDVLLQALSRRRDAELEAKVALTALARTAPDPAISEPGAGDGLPADWLKQDMARVDADVARWAPGVRESYEALHGPLATRPAQPAATPGGSDLTHEQRELARQCLGLPNEFRLAKRNRFRAGRPSKDWSLMVVAGLAKNGAADDLGGMWYWLTRAGAELALNADESLCPLSFPSISPPSSSSFVTLETLATAFGVDNVPVKAATPGASEGLRALVEAVVETEVDVAQEGYEGRSPQDLANVKRDRDIARAALAAAIASAPEQGVGWQPIETAPTDGTIILVTRQAESGFRFVETSAWRRDTFGKWHWGRNAEYDRSWSPAIKWMPLPIAAAPAPSHEEA